jgi:hypothetical protein
MDPVGLHKVMIKILNLHVIVKVDTIYYKISREEEKFYNRPAEVKCAE